MQKEKLRLIRKQKGYTQQQVADYIATDVSNYSRKESGDVRIIQDEWDKLARFLEVPIEDIYEDEAASVIVNNDHPVFNDRSSSAGVITNQNNYDNIPGSVIENLQGYIALLKEENERLKEELKGSQSPATRAKK
ncbi:MULTISPECIES: helix-turn-helix transcriptional regulator [unclassified Chryseobacterium]|uniref:helix-turn-helix transcriptional regulator n=1 Tax=unclassified Chryseobacterium TaxID=2593645 RepID=UPI00100B6319|nr:MULTISPECIES: helix-turn-helix transcriptional regulator [unclassified Chryseobacterium]RXM52623.1 transcriptional regulator [Chryseobacterium sp. CH25]RXM66679.1 transcriptional regulator [Chryseobacterium sp. CH1]